MAQMSVELPGGLKGLPGKCRGCGADVVFARVTNKAGESKTPPFNLDGASHFTTCPDAERWRRPRPHPSKLIPR